MTVSPETIIIGILSAMIVALGGIIVALIAARTNREANAVNFSKTLLERVTSLEDKVTRMEGDLNTSRRKVTELEGKLNTSQRALQAAVRFIDRLVAWGRSGAADDMPAVPEVLHDYLDQDVWMLPRPDVDSPRGPASTAGQPN